MDVFGGTERRHLKRAGGANVAKRQQAARLGRGRMRARHASLSAFRRIGNFSERRKNKQTPPKRHPELPRLQKY